MKFYIVDDVRSVVRVLDRIIEQKNLGEVIGFSTDAEKVGNEIIAKEPDIVLMDLLMPSKDGISIVNEVKAVRPQINFIMISQVTDKEMVSEAYKSGVEFFIHKPINIIEVETVIRRVMDKIQMETMLGGIREMIGGAEVGEPVKQDMQKKDGMKDIRYLLGVLGMLGERGTKDILKICEYCLTRKITYEKGGTITEYCNNMGEEEKMLKQRIRRAVKKGMSNMAHIGIEDYYSEIFQNYSQIIFDFEGLRAEMDFLKGNKNTGGKVVVDKFIEGLLIFNEIKE